MMGRRALWLDDLFIDPGHRGKGIGKAIMACLAGIALRHRCVRFEWIVLDWNSRAIQFYGGHGAEILPDWRICRVDESRLPGLAGNLLASIAELDLALPGRSTSAAPTRRLTGDSP